MPAADLALVGRHNALNALAALALASAVAKIDATVLAALRALRAACRTACSGRARRAASLYIDDSKGTTVAATLAALEGSAGPVVLIAGGDGKGQDFAPLAGGRARTAARCCSSAATRRRSERALAGTGGRSSRPATARRRGGARASRSRSPATRCCCRRPARASTCSRSYVERGERFADAGPRATVGEAADA